MHQQYEAIFLSFSRACYINLRAGAIDYMFRFYDAVPQNPALAHPLPALRFILFLLELRAYTQIYFRLHRFPTLEIQLLPSHSGCSCLLAKLLLSDLFSALSFSYATTLSKSINK